MKTINSYTEQELITMYLQGSMDEATRAEFEAQMAADPFLSEAVEGYHLNGALPEDLEILQAPEEQKTNRKLLGRSLMWLAAAACLALLIWLPFRDNIIPAADNNYLQLAYRSHGYHRIITSGNHDTLVLAETETLFITEMRRMPEPGFIPEKVEPLYVARSLTIDNNGSISGDKMNYSFRSNHPYTYLQGYKVVDYRFVKRNNQKFQDIPRNGADVNQLPDDIPDLRDTRLAYVDYLEQALLFLKNKNYTAATECFETILEQYPGDQNAWFYKAMCYYETGETGKASACFGKVSAAGINTFHQESQWYAGLILLEQKQYAAAEKALIEIVNENGYYGAQAKRELDDLYREILNNPK
ncbi:MAG TPA: tetratricopeptide repeat protein [Bacteroidales bacterium]|nr:tetratricopeptide repeat protein [Bacteroidales bacterium]